MYKLIRPKYLVSYEQGLLIQEKAFQRIEQSEELNGILIILEHKPVFTFGSGGGQENVLVQSDLLASLGIEIFDTNRGGNVTFHGPGQIVAYPIFNLARLTKDVRWFVNSLEETVIDVLSKHEIIGTRKHLYHGVWVGDEKISAVGINLRHWISRHGLSFNVNVNKHYFSLINPCGIKEFGVCTLRDFIPNCEIEKIKDELIQSFEKVFNIIIE